MTEPTDDELDAVIAEYRAGIYPQDMHPRFERAIMRAAIAKWGQPAHSGEPVAWLSPWRADQVTTDYDAYGRHGIPLYTAPQPSPAAQGDALDAERLDWLALAGPTSLCLVIDRPHDGEIEVATDDVTGYGKTLREAIDDARKQGANHD